MLLPCDDVLFSNWFLRIKGDNALLTACLFEFHRCFSYIAVVVCCFVAGFIVINEFIVGRIPTFLLEEYSPLYRFFVRNLRRNATTISVVCQHG